jgi:hypothetical protein
MSIGEGAVFPHSEVLGVLGILVDMWLLTLRSKISRWICGADVDLWVDLWRGRCLRRRRVAVKDAMRLDADV